MRTAIEPMARIGILLAALSALPAAAQTQPASLQRALQLADATEDQVVAWRRHIHQQPELSYEEVQTAAYVAAALARMPGIDVRTGIARTGIKAVLRGGRPGPVVALRADMDALPVAERNELPYRSTARAAWRGQETPVAHVCGHDTHVAMLLGAAQALSQLRAELPGTVVFLFQPAEEWGPGQSMPSGAPAMVQAGVLDDPKVDVVMGQHINARAPSGTITYRAGALMASGSTFQITLRGRGGHGSSPWTANDPTLAAAQIVLALQNVVSQRINPLEGTTVVTVGLLQAGNRVNILPDTAEIGGTVRTLSPANGKIAFDSIRLQAEKIAESAGLKAEVKIDSGYETLVSDPGLTRSLLGALGAAAGPGKLVETQPTMASEDFGSYAATGASVVFWNLSASPNGEKPGAPNHSPEFMIDEKAMNTGVRALVAATLGYMQQNPKR